MEGGISVEGNVDGTSLPANFPLIRCMATANPSLVSRPSLFKSARSLIEPSQN